MKKVFLGIDTSNYTTSACLMSEDDFVFLKTMLSVRHGEKGVRQSEAVFQHTKNLPSLIDKLFSEARDRFGEFEVCAVGVSTTPRRQEGSYMPCFLAGGVSAHSVAASSNCPLYEFSHQEGHIRAAIFGSGVDSSLSHFYSFHLSGGTCELLEVKKDLNRYDARIIADSEDITLGQLIDRTGVMLGMNFPCGAELEGLAENGGELPRVTLKKSKHINLSGFENKVQRMIEDGKPRESIASFVFGVCRKAVEVLLDNREDPTLPVIFSGGVASSHILKDSVSGLCRCYFAPPVFSADNAIGIAALTKDSFLLR